MLAPSFTLKRDFLVYTDAHKANRVLLWEESEEKKFKGNNDQAKSFVAVCTSSSCTAKFFMATYSIIKRKTRASEA